MRLNLKHTNRNPGEIQVAQYDKVVERSDKKDLERLRLDTEAATKKWEAWLLSDEGKAASSLADHEIRSLEARLAMSSMELAQRGYILAKRDMFNRVVEVSDNLVKEHKDQCIGALGVWKRIKFEPDVFRRRLVELDRLLGEKGGEDKENGWRPIS